MSHNCSEVLNTDANVEMLLDVQVLKIQTINRDGGL